MCTSATSNISLVAKTTSKTYGQKSVATSVGVVSLCKNYFFNIQMHIILYIYIYIYAYKIGVVYTAIHWKNNIVELR